jgi:hypothetical protein
MQCITGTLTMRTTLSIDDDILAAAKEVAATERKTVGEVISALARNGMKPINTRRRSRNGIPLLAVRRSTQRVTSRLVRQLHEELH